MNLMQNNLEDKYNLDIIMYQNNTPQSEKWDLDKMNIRFENLVKFIETNVNNTRTTAIIFSETEIPYVISERDNILKFLQSKLDNNTTILIGAIRKNTDKNTYYNTMFKINSKSIDYFDKQILVPFGEYIPLKKIIDVIDQYLNNK